LADFFVALPDDVFAVTDGGELQEQIDVFSPAVHTRVCMHSARASVEVSK
jgi:hypothetical protein